MAKYHYTAKSHPHKTSQGEIEAESEQEAISKLSKDGYFPLSITPVILSLEKQGASYIGKISNRDDIVLFTRQLSNLIESGINIINGLNIISAQTNKKYLKSILDELTSEIKSGKSLSESLAGFPYLFSNLYCSMIHAGEASGNLDEILKRLADFLEKGEEFKNSLRASLIYPAFVFAVGALTVLVLLIFLIPRLVAVFEDMGEMLPLPTKILISLSEFFRSYGWLILAIIFIFIFLFRRLCSSPQGRIHWDRLKLKLAVYGPIVLKTEISRLIGTLSLLLSSGIPITQALEICVSIVDNEVIKMEVQSFKEQIQRGLSLSTALKNSNFFSGEVTSIITVGEETGSLEKALSRIADNYEKEADRALKIILRLLEPIIILITGLIIGFIVLSMLLPIFQINLIVR